VESMKPLTLVQLGLIAAVPLYLFLCWWGGIL
jgi:hypothetical protein